MSEVVKTIVVPKQQEQSYTKVVHRCDICSKEGMLATSVDEIHFIDLIARCSMCGIEVCSDCRTVLGSFHCEHEWHTSESVYCRDCMNIGRDHIKLIDEAEAKFNDFAEEEMSRWKYKCMLWRRS